MYNSKNTNYNSARKRNLIYNIDVKNSSSELPTAVKSFYPEVSPTRADLSRSIRTPSKHDNQYQDVR